MDKNAQKYFYFYDGLGSVTDITDANGNLIENYSYDAYGQPSATSTIGNRYMFTGREFDLETGLYHYRARSYDPRIGRFLQRDPVEYVDSMNLYSYVRNNPVNYIDPEGKYISTLIGVVSGAIGGFTAGSANGNLSDAIVGTFVGAAVGGVVGTFAPSTSGTVSSIVVSGLIGATSNFSGQVLGNLVRGASPFENYHVGQTMGAFFGGGLSPFLPGLMNYGGAVSTFQGALDTGFVIGAFEGAMQSIFDSLYNNIYHFFKPCE